MLRKLKENSDLRERVTEALKGEFLFLHLNGQNHRAVLRPVVDKDRAKGKTEDQED